MDSPRTAASSPYPTPCAPRPRSETARGKRALISGTVRGQGRAAAPLRFAAEGALVVGGCLLHEEAVETQPLIAQEGARPSPPGPLDVTDEDSVRAWVASAADAFGGIDIVYADAHAAAAVRGLRLHDARRAGLGVADRRPPGLAASVRSRGCVLTAGSTAWRTGSPTNRCTAHSSAKGAR
ncbi:SDR family oxidoreductase [Streptomyces sp. NBC_01166]|uniref:SDR family oxidoreductase n=1 Tax=Streptomyces sp. NBC_01166 TaxID=2903755 RepID=UPI003868356D